jgi:hypothetical protein
MALVFTGSVEDPVECALQISQALRAQPSLPVRMGIHKRASASRGRCEPAREHRRRWYQHRAAGD